MEECKKVRICPATKELFLGDRNLSYEMRYFLGLLACVRAGNTAVSPITRYWYEGFYFCLIRRELGEQLEKPTSSLR